MNTIFVSSTFRDMYGERDIIQQKVVPAVNIVAEQYGESIWCKDLRWGVDTTDLPARESSMKVLNVCLDEIDRSNPPFIILIGERYGWMPGNALIREQSQRKNMQLEELEISVTALEIEYGVFCRNYTPVVYFREAEGSVPPEFRVEDEVHRKKLEVLKGRLRRLCGEELRTYRMRYNASGPNRKDLEEFADRLTDDICRIMRPKWEKVSFLTVRQKELMFQQNYLEERVQQYAHASEDEDVIYNTLVRAAWTQRQTISPYAGLSLYQNWEGTGKSMLFARITQRLKKKPMHLVLATTVGLTAASCSAMELLKSEVYALEAYVNSPHLEEETGTEAGEEEYRRRLDLLCGYLIGNGQRLFFLVDGIERLQPGPDRDKLVFLPGTGEVGIAMLLMARMDYSFPVGKNIEPAALTFRERNIALNGLLAYYGKELSEGVKFSVVQKSWHSGLQYMSMILKRLMMMSDADFTEINRRQGSIEEAINSYQEELIEKLPESRSELACEILEIIGRAINPEMTREVCELLTMSPFGLRESDLAAIMGERFDSLDLAALIQSWKECFLIMPDGRISFQSESVACGFLDHMDNILKVSVKIYDHLCRLGPSDELRRRYLLYFAQQCFRLTEDGVLRYIRECTKEETGEYVSQAAYALWRGRIFSDGTSIVRWIQVTQSKAMVDISYIPAFMDLWTILMAAQDYFRTDSLYEEIVTTYRDAVSALKKKYEPEFADYFNMRYYDCFRILADYYSDKGDRNKANEFRKIFVTSMEKTSAQRDSDGIDLSMHLCTLTTQLGDYSTSMRISGDREICKEADRVRDKLLELCRSSRIRADFPTEAIMGLVAVQSYESAVAGFHISDFSVSEEIDDLIRLHPELKEDQTVQMGLASFYMAESSRLSHALKGETIPEDRRKLAISYSMAAQEAYGRLIQDNPTQNLCMALASQKLNTARLLEQAGTERDFKAALQELIDASQAFSRFESLSGEAVVDSMFGVSLYNRMGIIASEISGGQIWGIMETAFDNTLVYARGVPDNYRNWMFMVEVFRNQSEILEKTGQRKHLEMADIRLDVCEVLMKALTERSVMKQLPLIDRMTMKKWARELKDAHKRIKKLLR